MKKSKQKRVDSLSKKISNRLSYTIIAFVGLMLVGVFVFAVVPNPGHGYRDLDLYPIIIKDSTHLFNVEIDGGLETEIFKAAAYCIVDDCITSWPSGGGGSQTLAEVLDQGNIASTLINMNNRDISNVGTLNVNNGITADDNTVEIGGSNSLSIGGGDLNVAGTGRFGYGNVVISSDIDLTDGTLKDANTVQTNILEDPEDGTLTVNDDLEVKGRLTGSIYKGEAIFHCNSGWQEASTQVGTSTNCIAFVMQIQGESAEFEKVYCDFDSHNLNALCYERGCDDTITCRCGYICGIK